MNIELCSTIFFSTLVSSEIGRPIFFPWHLVSYTEKYTFFWVNKLFKRLYLEMYCQQARNLPRTALQSSLLLKKIKLEKGSLVNFTHFQ